MFPYTLPKNLTATLNPYSQDTADDGRTYETFEVTRLSGYNTQRIADITVYSDGAVYVTKQRHANTNATNRKAWERIADLFNLPPYERLIGLYYRPATV